MSVTLNEERCRVCGKFFRLQTGRLPDYPVCPSCVAERSKAQGEDDSRAAEIKARDDMLQPVTPSAPCARCGHGKLDHDGDPGHGADRGCLESDPDFPALKCECGAYVAPKEVRP